MIQPLTRYNPRLARHYFYLHTAYFVPGPISCLDAFTALQFGVIDEDDVEFGDADGKIVVAGLVERIQIIELSPEVINVKVGDELLAVNDVPIKEYLESQKSVSGGANEYGSMKNTLWALTGRSGKYGILPKEDIVTYSLKSAESGKTYSASLPWILRKREPCYSTANLVYESVVAGNYTEPETSDFDTVDRTPLKYPIMKNFQLEFVKEEFVSPISQSKGITINPTEESLLKWGIYDKYGKNMGVIFIEEFQTSAPEKIVPVVLMVRGLLVKELKNTKSLLFDIRGNPGGYVQLADLIPQFFGGNIEAPNYRAINSKINAVIFSNAELIVDSEWLNALNSAPAGSQFTDYVKFNSDYSINQMGMAWVKPVGVLTDANCYSACDLFAANMKDNSLATIYGEDGTTGTLYVKFRCRWCECCSIELLFSQSSTRVFLPEPSIH
jgi:hypothetical protein